MKTVLHINSSARIERSHTRNLTDLFVKEWRSLRPQDHIISRDIGIEPPPPVNQDWIAAAFTPPANRVSAMHEVLRRSDILVDELIQADLIVLGAPMYNFGMPLNSRLMSIRSCESDGPSALIQPMKSIRTRLC